DRRVSRRHLRIEPGERGFRAVDLGSTHGTLINGAPAVADRALGDGDVVQVGAVVLVFRDGSLDEQGSIHHTMSRMAEPAVNGTGGEARRLRVLFGVVRVVAALDRVDDALERVLDMTLDVLDCQRGLVGVVEQGRTARQVARGDRDGEGLVVGAAALAAMLERRESVLVRGGGAAGGERWSMGAPMEASGRLLGFPYVHDRGRRAHFAAEDLDFLTALARLAGPPLDQALRTPRP